MPHELPALPYAHNALEPHIDARTMEIHHGKHHNSYANNLNNALVDYADLQSKSVEALLKDLSTVPAKIHMAVRNNGGGHLNHSLFWPSMTPNGGDVPAGKLTSAIEAAYGGFDTFKAEFSKAAGTRFGSGWAWLSVAASGALAISSTANQDNPVSEGLTPLLGLDVWEHAYYLNCQNRRPRNPAAWWNVVNWDEVAARLAAA